MTRFCRLISACVGLSVVILTGCASNQKHVPPPDLSFDAAGEHWMSRGVQVGEKIGDAVVYTIAGERVRLSSIWNHQPALLVTTSLSCPVAREHCPQLESIIDAYRHKLNVVLLYTLEAHPAGEECPYKPGEEWLTRANEEEGVYLPQPRTLEDRLILAREMGFFLKFDVPIYVDTMNNDAWLMLGAGPNLAVLIDTDGTVLAKQGWLNVEALTPTLRQHLGKPIPSPESAAHGGG